MPCVATESELLVLHHRAAVADRLGDDPSSWLSPQERRAVERLAAPERRYEWLRGRALAKLASQLVLAQPPAPAAVDLSGIGVAPRLRWAGGELPVSISHSGRSTACAVLGSTAGGSVGLDIEQIDPTLAELAARFCLAAEWRRARASFGPATAATLLWSAKESGIKAVRGRVVRRHSIEVEACASTRALRVSVTAGGDPAPQVFHGGFRRLGADVLTWLREQPGPVRVRALPPLALDLLLGWTCEAAA